MYRKIVWWYAIILTLLDISLNTKLTAQGKSHGASVQESLVEGIAFQEWGGGGGGRGVGSGEDVDGGGGALRLWPPSLELGPRALGAAHSAIVTITNVGNTTLHLASVAGTTPDFHASFFDSKTLPPEGNTTFSVVFVGRREGLANAHLYIHTSGGVYKYAVSAEAIPPDWGLWPLLGLRVPLNASIETALTLHNPTEREVQVTAVYSSGAWLRLLLPGGGAEAKGAAWRVPPHRSVCIVRLRVEGAAAAPHAATAYVRVKTDAAGPPLVLAVEARAAPPGELLRPLQLRLRARGSRDPPDTFRLEAATSAPPVGAHLEAGAAGRCGPSPPGVGSDPPAHHHNGAPSGVALRLLADRIQPHHPPQPVADLTLDYATLWAGSGVEAGDVGVVGAAWCSGVVRVGRAAMPYSVRLLPGTLSFTPNDLRFVTQSSEWDAAVTVRIHNEFMFPIRITYIDIPHDVHRLLQVDMLLPNHKYKIIPAQCTLDMMRVRMLDRTTEVIDTYISVHTNVTEYKLPIAIYSGLFDVEWHWYGWSGSGGGGDSTLSLGAVSARSTRVLSCTVHNRSPRTLCLTHVHMVPPAQHFTLHTCKHLAQPPPEHACRCIPGGGSTSGSVSVVAGSRAGVSRGGVTLHTDHAALHTHIELLQTPGTLHAAHAHQHAHAAPYAWAEIPLVIESSMSLRMRVLTVQPPIGTEPDVSVEFVSADGVEIRPGRTEVGVIRYAPERACAPHCYTGLQVHTDEGAAWLARAITTPDDMSSLVADINLRNARQRVHNDTRRDIPLEVHTTGALHVAVSVSVRLWWPRVCVPCVGGGGGAGGANPTAPELVGAVWLPTTRTLRLRNPSTSHPLVLQPTLGQPPPNTDDVLDVWGSGGGGYTYSSSAFTLSGWRPPVGAEGAVRLWAEGAPASLRARAPLLLLAPAAEVDVDITFTPHEPKLLATYLYLRNNLSVVEVVRIVGSGAVPRLELAGRPPGDHAPILFEVSECAGDADVTESDGGGGSGGGVVRRTVMARNTGSVGVSVRMWRVAGAPCKGRGFIIRPCGPLLLSVNASAPLTLEYAPDYTQSRATAALEAVCDAPITLTFRVASAAPPRLLRRCAAQTPRPPFEPALRAAAHVLALALLALVLAAGALDADRLLRRCRPAPAAPTGHCAARAPLDLRALGASLPPPVTSPAPPPPVAPPPPPPPPRRRRARKVDPLAESRAFERWRLALRAAAAGAAPASAPPGPPQQEAGAESGSSRGGTDSDSSSTSSTSSTSCVSDDVSGVSDASGGSIGSGVTEAVSVSPPRTPPAASPSPTAPHHHHHPPSEEAASTSVSSSSSAAVVPISPSSLAAPLVPCSSSSSRRRPDIIRPPPPRHPPNNKHHTRKDKPSKRRTIAPMSAPRSPTGEIRVGGGGVGGPGVVAPAAVRWGASWSSVVARSSATPPPAAPAPLPPIGSDLRRRAPDPPAGTHAPTAPAHQLHSAPAPPPPPANDHSLFYFNGESAVGAGWAPPPPRRDYLTPTPPLWGTALESRAPGSAWRWSPGGGGGAQAATAAVAAPPQTVRPPPGFGAPAAAPPSGAPGGGREVRPFDPFQSLASIWTRTALDWRPDDEPPQ